jgi:osmotically-inducible protein OsmY
MLADPLRAPENHDVEATVADGIVTLHGTVRFPMDLPVLAAMVWQLPGVVDVRNEATGREPNPSIIPS